MWDNYRALRALANKLLLLAIVMLLYAGGYWLVHSPLFPVRVIYIQGDMQKVTPEQLRYIAGHELHGTFFTLNIDNTRAAFEKLPWVREAQVRRRWPDGLEIQVAEHEAIARWGENGLIDTSGDWFDAASDQQLPVLSGPENSEKTLAAMLPKLTQWLAPSGLKPVRIELQGRGAWRVLMSNDVWIELGRGEMAQLEKRARRFAMYWPDVKSRLPNGVNYVDMRYPNGFAVQPAAMRTAAREDRIPNVGVTRE